MRYNAKSRARTVRRRRAVRGRRRLFKKRRIGGTTKSRFGRVRRVQARYNRTPAPIAKTTLSYRNSKPLNVSMYRYNDGTNPAVTNCVNSWVIRANDIVHPMENNLSSWNSDGSVLALEDHARYYIRHQVLGFRYKAHIRMMLTSPQTRPNKPLNPVTGASLDIYTGGVPSTGSPGLVMGYVGWRILNACPDDMRGIPNGECYKRIVQGQEPGWRFKRFNTTMDKQFVLKIDTGYIPSTKFYHAPFMSQQTTTENVTQDLANPLTWTGPSDKTFIQFVIFADGLAKFVGEPNTSGPEFVQSSINALPFHLQAGMEHKAIYHIRSYERRGEVNDAVETTYTPCTDPVVTVADLTDGPLDEVEIEHLEP